MKILKYINLTAWIDLHPQLNSIPWRCICGVDAKNAKPVINNFMVGLIFDKCNLCSKGRPVIVKRLIKNKSIRKFIIVE